MNRVLLISFFLLFSSNLFAAIVDVKVFKSFPRLNGNLFRSYGEKEQRSLSEAGLKITLDNGKTFFIKFSSKKEEEKLKRVVYSYSDMAITLKDHEVRQYELKLNELQKKKLFQNFYNYTPESSKFDPQRYTSSSVLLDSLDITLKETRGYIYKVSRHSSRGISTKAMRFKRLSSNPFKISDSLQHRGVIKEISEFRFRYLKNEVCAYYPEKSVLPCHRVKFENINNEIQDFFDEKLVLAHQYLHKGQKEKFDGIIESILAEDNKYLSMARKGMNVSALRYELFLPLLYEISENYADIRFLEEGGFEKFYSFRFVKALLNQVKRWGIEGVNVNMDLVQSIEDQLDTDLQLFGNNLGIGLVNALGQVFKKRKWVPNLRMASNFRKNYLTEFREKTMADLFSEGGMQPGDIILEKDSQANTDVLIPGYWVHASYYLGSINDLKRLGLWNDPTIASIQKEIELYKTDSERQHMLNNVWKNTLPFEEIPFFVESDRPGVGVHPLIKFLQTDGMAVLRPTRNWNKESVKKVIKRSNKYLYFPYDYIHNVRNKYQVTCSKLILKVYDEITFPVSKSLRYYSVSPDQIGQPVSLNLDRPDSEELKLIMFFDYNHKGKMTFHHLKQRSEVAYSEYLKASQLVE